MPASPTDATAYGAALLALTGLLSRTEAQIVAAIHAGPEQQTCPQIAEVTGLHPVTVTRLRADLRDRGMLAGERSTYRPAGMAAEVLA